MRIVKCNKCGEIFSETEITIPGHCYACYSTDIAEITHDDWNKAYIPKEKQFLLWSYFNEIPINNNDEIEEDFFGYPAGTNRFDIWKWFDNHYIGGVYKLIKDYEKYKHLYQ